MITSIKLDKVDTKNAWHVSYAFSCPKIVDKLFNFIPGLNVICGYNGCGKSTLLHVIRKLTFCDNEIVSQVNVTNHTSLVLHGLVKEGIFSMTDLQNDWNKSVFSMRPSNEVDRRNQDDTIENLVQAIEGGRSSAGMDTTFAIMQLLDTIKKNKWGEREDIKDFRKMVLDAPMHYSNHTNTAFTINSSETGDCKAIRDYIASHQVDSDKHTVLLDEPDRSVDVCMIDALYKLLVPRKDKPYKHQFIVVFHNPAIMYRLYKEHKDEINWIELTPGYLDNIVRFTEGQPVIRPTAMDWLCERKER